MAEPGSGDAALVARARGGDHQAFADIFDRHAPRIHAFCSRVLGDPHTAADATQDTFVTAVRRLDQLRDPSALRPWLYAIARNECTRHGRARDRATPVADVAVMAGERPVADDGPARAASATEVAELLWAAADGLDDRDRTLLDLQLRHGLEGSDLALAAGISPGQISMATGRLRERLERAVGALLVARAGRADCAGLQVVLGDWDGRFSVLWRKRVARHVDRCDVCDDRQRVLVAPLGSLAVVPLAATFALGDLPDGLRSRTLDAMASVRPAGRGRRSVLLAVAVAVVVLVAVVAGRAWWPTDSSDGDIEQVASGATATSSTSSTTATSATSSTSIATSTTAAVTVPPTAKVEGPAVVTTTLAPTTAPPVIAPPVTAPPDSAPRLGPLARSGSASMQTSCNPANATRTISVAVTDDRGIASVVLRWDHSGSGAGQRTMARSGGTWSTTLGPFADVGSVSFRVVATDSGGHTASTGTSSVTIDPCPG